MDIKEALIKSIQTVVEKNINYCNYDVTYKTVIKEITPKGYIILDRAGSKRTVKCCIPNMELRIGQSIYVKEPMSDINNIHICGIA